MDCRSRQSHARDVMSIGAASTTSPTNVILRQGVAAAQNCDFERARALLQQVTEETPDDVIAWYWLAIASPSPDTAIPCLRRVLTIDAVHVPAQDALARLLILAARAAAAAGRREEASKLAMEAAALTPDVPEPWQAMADLANSQVDRINALRRLVAIVPGDVGRRTQLRQALLARAVTVASDDRVEARSRFREAAILNPSDVRIWQALTNLADTEEDRLQSLRDLLRVAPHHDEGRAALRKALVDDARALSASGDVSASLGRWHEALELTGGDVECWLGLAATTTDQAEATRAIQSAQAIDRDDPRIKTAIEWLHGPTVDPSVLPAASDAFARFEDGFDASSTAPDAEVDDTLFDALAMLPHTDTATVATPLPIAMPAMSHAIETPAPQAMPLAAALVEVAPIDVPPALVATANPVEAATIMVIDDSPTIRKILALTLERAGYNVVAEPDGRSALARLQEILPRVILLDIAMPDLDGYEVCKRIKQDPRTTAVPVIMLSGKGAFFDKVKGHMAGATEYLTKPFETPAVLAVVTAHCQAEVHHG